MVVDSVHADFIDCGFCQTSDIDNWQERMHTIYDRMIELHHNNEYIISFVN